MAPPLKRMRTPPVSLYREGQENCGRLRHGRERKSDVNQRFADLLGAKVLLNDSMV